MEAAPREIRKVLVTGAAGAVGTAVCAELCRRGYDIRGLGLEPCEALADYRQADLTDRAAVRDAMAGVDALIHLAAYPNNADFLYVLLKPNVIGLYHVMDAAREHQVRRVVLASTAQTIMGLDRSRGVRVEDGTAPTNHYALTKVWAEEMGRMYARVHGMTVLAVRLCWLLRNVNEFQRLHANRHNWADYLSANDAGRFFAQCIGSDRLAPGQFEVLYATSRPPDEMVFDLTPARKWIGYEPEDTFPEGLGFALPEEWSAPESPPT